MTLRQGLATTSKRSNMHNASETHLQGYWLIIARVMWVAVAILSIGLFVASIPPYYGQLLTHSTCNLDDPAGVPTRLAQLGLSIGFYALYATVLIILMTLAFFHVALLIFWRKSDEWVPFIVSLVLLTFGVSFPNILDALATAYPVLSLPAQILSSVGFT